MKLTFAAFLVLLNSLPGFSQNRTFTVAYFGDSITMGWMDAGLHPDSAYPAKTDSLLRSHGLSIVSHNLGKSGENTDDALARIDTGVLNLNPDVVVVAFGSNDYYIHGWTNGPRTTLDRFRYNLQILCKKLQADSARVILLGMAINIPERFHHFSPESLYVAYGGVVLLQAQFETIIKEVAEEMTIPYVRGDLGENADALTGFDGVHPLPVGHALIAARLDSTIRAVIADTVATPPTPPGPPIVYPSPFSKSVHGAAVIEIPAVAGEQITVAIYNSYGALVRLFKHVSHRDGIHYVLWDGTNELGMFSGKGAYFLFIASPLQSHNLVLTIL